MNQKPVLAVAVVATLVLGATVASACPFNAAENAGDSNKVASSSVPQGQGGTASQSSTN